MLTLKGKRRLLCDGGTRRHFLQIGGLALGGLSLPDILQAEALAAPSNDGVFPKSGGLGHKAIIMVYLSGGPSHQDMYDLKMDAPAEIRGEFKPIATNVPGIQICEHLPRLAKMMDKVAIIRSLYGGPDQHASDMCMSGYPIFQDKRQSGHPSLGSVVSRVNGPEEDAMPPFVSLSLKTKHAPYSNPGLPGFLGAAHAPFQPEGQGAAYLKLEGITLDRLADRKALLNSVDRFRREADRDTNLEEMDKYKRRAFEILTSRKLVDALDVEREDSKLRDRYGRGSSAAAFGEDAGPHWMDQFLVARRLVEAGVRCVTLSFGSWDRHGANFERLRIQLPLFDQAITALVQDLHDRGLQDDVSVIAWGEFGRTPKINAGAGRDHWPRASCALLAGGGMRMGQVIGSTNRLGEEPLDRPVHYQNVFATLYHQLGIDPQTTTLRDRLNRPHYLLEHRQPISELI